MPRRDDEHPCDGIWIEADPFVPAGAKTLRAAERRALRDGAAGWTITARAWDDDAAGVLDSLPIRVDLAAATGRGGGPKELDRVLDLGADLVGIPADLQLIDSAAGQQSVRRILERAAADEVDVVLLMRRGDADLARAIVELVRSSEGILAVSIERHDEEVLDTLAEVDGLGVFAPGQEFASSFRRGANAIDRFLGLLSPAAAVHLLALFHSKVDVALGVERRLQRFVETELDQVTRRIGASDEAYGGLLVALGGWCPPLPVPELDAVGSSVGALRESLASACPELATFLP